VSFLHSVALARTSYKQCRVFFEEICIVLGTCWSCCGCFHQKSQRYCSNRLSEFSIVVLHLEILTLNSKQASVVARDSVEMAEASGTVSRSWPYFDPEYETGGPRYNPPRVVIDNDAYEDVTVVKFHSANRHGILLSVVQVLTDLELAISKAYISSDGEWFMDGVSAAHSCSLPRHSLRRSCACLLVLLLP
jgi:hypothetical protein